MTSNQVLKNQFVKDLENILSGQLVLYYVTNFNEIMINLEIRGKIQKEHIHLIDLLMSCANLSLKLRTLCKMVKKQNKELVLSCLNLIFL
jgi:hypothetical protein